MVIELYWGPPNYKEKCDQILVQIPALKFAGNMCWQLLGKDRDLLSRETGIPISILTKVLVLYLALVSKRIDVCPDRYEAYAKKLKAEWKRLFEWFPWCVSTHRLCDHAPEMIRLLPPTIRPWMLSEVSTLLFTSHFWRPLFSSKMAISKIAWQPYFEIHVSF